MKQLSSMFAIALFALNLLVSPVLAVNNTTGQVISYEDGSYAVITTGSSSATRATANKERTYTYYNPQGQRCFAYTLYASFTYNGVTSQAVSCEGGATIYRQGWEPGSHSEYVSGSTAYGRATFTGPDGQVRTVSLTLTCDKDGNVT